MGTFEIEPKPLSNPKYKDYEPASMEPEKDGTYKGKETEEVKWFKKRGHLYYAGEVDKSNGKRHGWGALFTTEAGTFKGYWDQDVFDYRGRVCLADGSYY